MSLNFSFSKLAFRLTTLLVFGAAIHICIILILPYVSQGDAWNRLSDAGEINQLAILPDISSDNRPFAFMAPDVRYAACRYDLEQGPVQLRSPLPNNLWSIALYSRYGENYYLISGRDVQSKAINLLVVNDKTIDNEKQAEQEAAQNSNSALREITVSAPTKKGIILIRAPVPYPAYEKQVFEQLKKALCRPITFNQQAAMEKR